MSVSLIRLIGGEVLYSIPLSSLSLVSVNHRWKGSVDPIVGSITQLVALAWLSVQYLRVRRNSTRTFDCFSVTSKPIRLGNSPTSI
jgi:hypothetical protein